MVFICQYSRENTFPVKFPSTLNLLTPEEEKTVWEMAVEAAKILMHILTSKSKDDFLQLLAPIRDIVPAIVNEMRKGEYLKSIYPTQFKSAVNAAEEDVIRFICSQLMHSMGEKVTKITDLELKEFLDPEADIIFEPWLNTCLTRKPLISFDSNDALVKTLGWYNDTGDIHIF